jgi:hypothetical protein
VCSACSCPASASLRQISTFRERHTANGGKVLTERAAITDRDIEIGPINIGDVLLWGFVIVWQILIFFLYEYSFTAPLFVLTMIVTVVVMYKGFVSFFGKGHR